MPDEIQRVRPLTDDDQRPAPPSPPRLALLLTILAIGALVGWGFSALGRNPSTTIEAGTTEEVTGGSPVELAASDPAPSAAIDWVKAAEVPTIPDSYDYAGATRPVEFGGSLYIAMRFFHTEKKDVRNELWISEDGEVWRSEQLQLGEPVSIVGLVATSDGLLISGSDADRFALWSSIPNQAIDGSSWRRVNLQVPASVEVSYHSIVVNDAGEVVVTVIANSNIWREVVAPHVPDGIDPADPDIRLFLGDLYLADDNTSIPIFAEQPEVVTTDDSVWVQFLTIDGEESLESYDLPAGVYPLETTPNLSHVPVTLSWFSEDGTSFLPVLGRNALPEGYFLPEPWGDGFIAAAYSGEGLLGPHDDVRLWHTNSGRAWQPFAVQPPAACAEASTTSSRDRILLTGDDGTQCVGSIDGEWKVLEDRITSGYMIGGPGGFIGYPDGFNYDTALFSPDGETWTSLEIPATEPYPTIVPLEHRLFMLSVNPPQPRVPKQIDLWLGEYR